MMSSPSWPPSWRPHWARVSSRSHPSVPRQSPLGTAVLQSERRCSEPSSPSSPSPHGLALHHLAGPFSQQRYGEGQVLSPCHKWGRRATGTPKPPAQGLPASTQHYWGSSPGPRAPDASHGAGAFRTPRVQAQKVRQRARAHAQRSGLGASRAGAIRGLVGRAGRARGVSDPRRRPGASRPECPPYLLPSWVPRPFSGPQLPSGHQGVSCAHVARSVPGGFD